jgi:hypothetical protein
MNNNSKSVVITEVPLRHRVLKKNLRNDVIRSIITLNVGENDETTRKERISKMLSESNVSDVILFKILISKYEEEDVLDW